jgi:hypothetical protein
MSSSRNRSRRPAAAAPATPAAAPPPVAFDTPLVPTVVRVITVVNQSTVVSAADAAAGVAAVQQQLAQHFGPAWGIAGVRLEFGPDTTGERIYLMDDSDQADALGYHEDTHQVPVGYVFAKTDLDAGDTWTSTLSHEALEQVVDPFANAGVLASLGRRAVLVALEVCDAVENDVYQIGGVEVSNFVLPAWFNNGFSGGVDFMGRLKKALTLSAGGYVAYTPDLRNWQQVLGKSALARQAAAPGYSRRSRRLHSTARAHLSW